MHVEIVGLLLRVTEAHPEEPELRIGVALQPHLEGKGDRPIGVPARRAAGERHDAWSRRLPAMRLA